MSSFYSVFFGYIVPASTLIPIVSGLVYYKQINSALRTLLIYLCGAFLINVTGSTMAGYGINNLPLLHFYTMFEVVAVLFYFREASNDKVLHRWIAVLVLAFPIYCIINFSFFQSIFQFNTYTRPIGAMIIIVFSIIYLSKSGEEENDIIISNSGKWVASGMLIYFCSSLFQFIFSNLVSQNATREVKLLIWNIHAAFVLFMYLFFFYAIINDRRQRQY